LPLLPPPPLAAAATAPTLPCANPAAAFCVASGERLDYEAACKQFRVESGDLSFLAEVQYVTVGNNRFAFRRISLGAPADATPLLLLMG